MHPRGGYFTRGSGHDKHAAYTEDSAEYQEVVDRLARKLLTAASAAPVQEMHLETETGSADIGIVSLGGCHAAVLEAVDRLRRDGMSVDYMRIRAFPFPASARAFVESHERCFVVEQNRDGQLRSLLALETGLARDRMSSILDYGGLPLTADRVVDGVRPNIAARHPEERSEEGSLSRQGSERPQGERSLASLRMTAVNTQQQS